MSRDKVNVIEEIKEKTCELHKAIGETIEQQRRKSQSGRYISLEDGAQEMADIKEGYGLVLGGGGGRGSYEIGVWKALMEYSDKIDIRAVSGSSVGALNAAVYACGDIDKAEKLWYDITNERILSNKDIDEEDRNRLFDALKEKLASIDNPVVKGAIECIGLDAVARGMKIKDGFFSRDGLREILEKGQVMEGVSASDMTCYATCLNVEGKPTPERFKLNGMEPSEIEDILMASSAIPVVFPMETIDETKYYDGGFFLGGDNVPIKPLYDEGYRRFIAVHLDGRRTASYEDAECIHIYPSVPLGGAIDGMLDFSPEGVRRRLEQGYADARRVLSRYFGGGSLYFTRHGQTVWNVENKICGVTDIELTEQGHSQAVALGEKIRDGGYHIDEILCSPLVRASETARHISELTGIPVRNEERLREQCFGVFEGTARNGETFVSAKSHFLDHYDGGESMAQLIQRVYNLLDEISEESRQTGKVYLLVAHNGISRVVQSYFNDMTNEEYGRFGIKNCELVEYRFK